MKKSVERCLGEVIISCQAYEDTPFYGPDNIRKFVQSAMMGGAKAVRCCWPQDIKAARECGDLVIIGINKIFSATQDVDDIFITPTFESAKEVIEAGADILAIDVRFTPKRGKAECLSLLKQIHEAYPEIAVMADCRTFEEGKTVAESGFVDIVSTTLSGMQSDITGPDYQLVRKFKEHLSLPINAEGRIWELNDLKLVEAAGADIVTIGSAVTRPHEITKRFIDYYNKIRD